MEDYDITTLPEGYEPLEPSNTGGFRIFVILVSVAVLCLSGYGLLNWLETGEFMRTNAVETPAIVERPHAGLRTGPEAIITETFDLRTKDGVLVSVEVRTKGAELSHEAKTALRNLVSDTVYDEMHRIRPDLQAWTSYFDVDAMGLKSKTPLTQPPESEGGEIREDLIKEGPGGTNE